MIKEVSIHPRRGKGGMVQVSGTGSRAKEALKILKSHDCEPTGWTVSGSKGERVYTYQIDAGKWPEVQLELREIEDRMQLSLFKR